VSNPAADRLTRVAVVESINLGPAVAVPWGRYKWSAIDKRPVAGPVQLRTHGVDGDEIGDLVNHGGPAQAVYAYAAEDLLTWSQQLGRELRPGQFGENLTTRGIDLTRAVAGERWRVGGTLLEISGVRIPCSVFQGFLGEKQWTKTFLHAQMPGPYLRVLVEGPVAVGDPIEVVEQPDHGLTVEMVFRALTTERALLPRLADEPRIAEFVARRLGERRNDPAR
jgi:MOSC domain-containing protein YiiM